MKDINGRRVNQEYEGHMSRKKALIKYQQIR
jgi:hypothetical protein